MDKLLSIDYIINRVMFDGYGIFYEGVLFAIIMKEMIYFKIDETNRTMYREAASKRFQHGISY